VISSSHLGEWKLRAGENLCEEEGKILRRKFSK
jgi:hypothetical protein